MENKNSGMLFPKKQEIETNTLYYLSAEEVLEGIAGNNKGNRRLPYKDPKRDPDVKKFKKKMLNGEWYFALTIITILANDITIVNGWRRIQAIKLAREEDPTFNPHFYIRFVRAKDEKEIRDIIDIENGKDEKGWDPNDFCTMWVENEHPTFCTLLKFCETPEYSRLRLKQKDNGKPLWGKAAMLFGISQNDFKKRYKDGDWYLSKEDIEAAPERYYQVVQLINAFGNDPSNDAWLYVAQDWIDLTRNNADFKYRFSHLPGGLESICKAIKTFPFEDRQAINKNNVYRQRFWNALFKAESWYK